VAVIAVLCKQIKSIPLRSLIRLKTLRLWTVAVVSIKAAAVINGIMMKWSKAMSGHNNTGITFPNLLFLVFLTLKLTGVITWSWWWVTAPLWVPIIPALVVFLLVLRRL